MVPRIKDKEKQYKTESSPPWAPNRTSQELKKIDKHHCFVTETVMVTHVGRDEQQRACKIQWKQAET